MQWAKDPALILQQLTLLLWCRFDAWPGKLHMPQAWPKQNVDMRFTRFLKMISCWLGERRQGT